jgi:AI-2 transport protein TqsA
MRSDPDAGTTATRIAIIVTAVVAVAAVGYAMRPVVLPIVLAIFLAALGRPLQVRLQRLVPPGIALTITVLIIGASLIALPLIFAANIQVVIARIPTYAPRIGQVLKDIEGLAADAGLSFRFEDLNSDSMVESLLGVASNAVYGLFDFLGTVALVIFILVFILSEANILKSKLAIALKPTNHAAVSASFSRIQDRIQQYVTTKTLFAALDAAACGLITWGLGIDFPALWTLLTFTLYFIPNLGVIIATFPPVLIALIQFPEPTTAIAAFILLTVAFNVLGNVIEPKFLGRTLGLSPLVVFTSLLIWGWYLGIIGVLLSVPLTVVIRIICEHVEPLRPVAVLMSDKAGALARRELDDD